MLENEDSVYESYLDNEIALENLDRTFVVLEQLTVLQDIIKDKGTVDQHDIQMMRVASEMALAGTGQDTQMLLPSLENYTDPGIALESISETVSNALEATTKHFGNIFMSIVDTLEMAVTVFERQSSDIKKLREQIRNKTPKGSITIRNSKYFLYGDNKTVIDLDDYIKQLQFTLKECSLMIDAVSELQRNSLFQSFATLLSFILGYDKKYLELFLYLNEFIEEINKIPSVKQDVIKDRTVYYKSSTYLGLAHIGTSTPKPGSYDKFSIPSVKSTIGDFSAKVYRDTVLDFSPGEDEITFTDIKIKQLTAILDANEVAIDSYKKLLSFTKKLSNIEAALVSASFLVILKKSLVMTGVTLFFDNYRLLLKLTTAINATAGTVFNLTRGNIATGNRVVRNALK